VDRKQRDPVRRHFALNVVAERVVPAGRRWRGQVQTRRDFGVTLAPGALFADGARSRALDAEGHVGHLVASETNVFQNGAHLHGRARGRRQDEIVGQALGRTRLVADAEHRPAIAAQRRLAFLGSLHERELSEYIVNHDEVRLGQRPDRLLVRQDVPVVRVNQHEIRQQQLQEVVEALGLNVGQRELVLLEVPEARGRHAVELHARRDHEEVDGFGRRLAGSRVLARDIEREPFVLAVAVRVCV
jgi:hypothetical protein